MKNLMLALMCTLMAFVGSATENPNVKTLELEGIFLSKSNVTYTVYELDGSDTVEVITKKGFRGYSVNLEVGKTYIIRFVKNDLTKTLKVTATHTGEMDLDVDFKSKYSGSLTYDEKRDHYTVRPYYPENG